jgi:CubicO group peptidase (beta-lactamase class C family)
MKPAAACLAGLLLATTARGDGPKGAPVSTAELEHRIRDVLAETRTPGMGACLVTRNEVLWSAGIGKADVARGRDATPDTLFRIGSISKTFVSLAVLQLQEEGRLNLNDTVRGLAPEIRFENRWEETDPVRILHLLEHTTGFDDLALREYAHGSPRPVSLADALAFHPGSRLARWRPGTRFSYCNSGPPIAAYVVEKLAGRRFEDVVRERLFDPLRMTTATYLHPDPSRASFASLYHPDGVTPYPYWHVIMRPSGSINASPAEMGRLVQLLLNRGSFEGRKLLEPASIARMEAPRSTLAAQEGMTAGYGLGNFTRVRHGFVFHGHDGGVEGGRASFGYLPAEGVGYVFMINSGSGRAFEEVHQLVTGYLTRQLPKPSLPPAAEVSPETMRRFTGVYRPDSPRQEIGRFLERILGIARVSVGPRGLTLSPLAGGPRRYVAVSGRLFRREDSPIPTLALINDATEGQLIQSDSMTYRPASAILAWLEVALGAVSLLVMATAPLFALVWVPRWAFGRLRGSASVRLRTAPLVSVLLLAAALALPVMSKDDLIRRFGNPTPWSIGFAALTAAFAAAAFVGVLVGLRVPKGVDRRVARHSQAVAAAAALVAAYLGYWGIIGLRSWL